MRYFLRLALAAATAVLLAGGLASASIWGHSKSSMKTTSIDLAQDSKIPNGPSLKAGAYKVELLKESPTAEVAFYQDGKLMAKTPARLVSKSMKNNETKILTNTGKDNTQVITEIDPDGWNQDVVFSNSTGNVSSSKSGL